MSLLQLCLTQAAEDSLFSPNAYDLEKKNVRSQSWNKSTLCRDARVQFPTQAHKKSVTNSPPVGFNLWRWQTSSWSFHCGKGRKTVRLNLAGETEFAKQCIVESVGHMCATNVTTSLLKFSLKNTGVTWNLPKPQKCHSSANSAITLAHKAAVWTSSQVTQAWVSVCVC